MNKKYLQNKSLVPLVVDLDGTLIYSDLLWEAIFIFLRRHWIRVWQLPFWLLLGKIEFKERLSKAVYIDPMILPYDKNRTYAKVP